MSDREDDHAAALDRLEDLIVADDSPHSTLAAAGDMRARGSPTLALSIPSRIIMRAKRADSRRRMPPARIELAHAV